jgi:hypothetical protein
VTTGRNNTEREITEGVQAGKRLPTFPRDFVSLTVPFYCAVRYLDADLRIIDASGPRFGEARAVFTRILPANGV